MNDRESFDYILYHLNGFIDFLLKDDDLSLRSISFLHSLKTFVLSKAGDNK